MSDVAVFRGGASSVSLDWAKLRCSGCGATVQVSHPQPATRYQACDCADEQELVDYRATLADGKVVGPRWGELPKRWMNP